MIAISRIADRNQENRRSACRGISDRLQGESAITFQENPHLASAAPRICVIAAPGSGKTKRILLPKVAQILSDEAIDPSSVLLLSFSRLSALDLKARLESELPRAPRASTVHSYCLGFLLSENNHDIRGRIESILLEFEKEALIADLSLQLTGLGKRNVRRMLGEFAAGWATRPHEEVFDEDDTRRAFKAAVVRWLEDHRASMMEEIVYHAVSLAQQLPESRFIDGPQFILVDEYQDLNELEQAFVEALARKSRLLLAVGDPDQSIYSFKYAHPRGIVELARTAQPYVHATTGRCPRRVVYFAAQILRQANPGRATLLDAGENVGEGEVHLVVKAEQVGEFRHVLLSMADRLRAGVRPKDILLLAPRRRLAAAFTEYATAHAAEAGVPEGVKFSCVQRPEFSDLEQERILLIGLVVNPTSILRLRTYLGIGDDNARAAEIQGLKDRFGGLPQALERATVEEIPARNKRLRGACQRLVNLRGFLANHREAEDVEAVLNDLVPRDEAALQSLRAIFDGLREEDDTISSLYGKFLDFVRSVPSDDQTIRTMTLRGSKGLDADHVYIVGCNSGNLPGPNFSPHLTDADHLQEQRRLLYVGFTRAKASLTVSWSRLIPLEQAFGSATSRLGVVTRDGRKYARVGLCEFLQNLAGVQWET